MLAPVGEHAPHWDLNPWRTERARRGRGEAESLGWPYPSEPEANEDIPPSDRERAEGFRGESGPEVTTLEEFSGSAAGYEAAATSAGGV